MDGLTTGTVQFPRRRVAEEVQNKAFPFLQLGFLLRILKQLLANGHLASGKASPQTPHFSVYSCCLINGIRTVQLKILHIEGKKKEKRHSRGDSYKFKFKTCKRYFSPL